MSKLVSIDGTITRAEDARVSVYDRGFLYGDSVFETVRTYNREPYALAEHLDRLARSAVHVHIPLPVTLDVLAREVREVIAQAHNPESSARIMLTRGTGPLGLDPTVALTPLRVIIVEPLHTLAASMYDEGVGVILVQTQRAGDATGGTAKVGNYLASVLALSKARAAGAHEALILNQRGEVAEGTTSNVFMVRGGVVTTPPLDAGILPGITRQKLLEAARGMGIPVREASISPADLVAADEVFLSSSIREVLPVVRIDGRPVGSGRPGPMTKALHGAFRRAAGVLPLGTEPSET
jgi:branched-chain amino acid aminotransferase